jgi:hypothetical protein
MRPNPRPHLLQGAVEGGVLVAADAADATAV